MDRASEHIQGIGFHSNNELKHTAYKLSLQSKRVIVDPVVVVVLVFFPF